MLFNLMLAAGLLAPLAFPDVFVGGEEPDDTDNVDAEPVHTPESDMIRDMLPPMEQAVAALETTEVLVENFDAAEDLVMIEIAPGEEVEIIEHAEEDGDTVFLLSNGTEVVLTNAVGVSPDVVQFMEAAEA